MSEEEKKAIEILNNIKGFKRIGILQATETFYEAIETILNLIEKQNKELEPIRELGIPVKTLVAELNRLEGLEDDREQLKAEIEELKEDYKDLYISNEHKKRNWVHKSILNSYIPKSVIREKIEELEKEKGGTNTSNYDFHEAIEEIYNNQIDILKELLGGSNE